MTDTEAPPEIDFAGALLDPPKSDVWQIQDFDEASRAVMRLRHYDATVADHHVNADRLRDRIHDAAEKELAKVQAWEDAVTAKPLKRIGTYRGALLDWFRRLRDDDPDLTTYKLPGATLERRQNPVSLAVTDDRAVIQWLDALPAGDPRKAAIKRTVLKSYIQAARFVDQGDGTSTLYDESGELIPGVVQVAGEEKFDVKLEADDDE